MSSFISKKLKHNLFINFAANYSKTKPYCATHMAFMKWSNLPWRHILHAFFFTRYSLWSEWNRPKPPPPQKRDTPLRASAMIIELLFTPLKYIALLGMACMGNIFTPFLSWTLKRLRKIIFGAYPCFVGACFRMSPFCTLLRNFSGEIWKAVSQKCLLEREGTIKIHQPDKCRAL